MLEEKGHIVFDFFLPCEFYETLDQMHCGQYGEHHHNKDRVDAYVARILQHHNKEKSGNRIDRRNQNDVAFFHVTSEDGDDKAAAA